MKMTRPEIDQTIANLDAEIAAWQKLPDTKSKSRSKTVARLQKLKQQLKTRRSVTDGA
jgi:hypothetical protein